MFQKMYGFVWEMGIFNDLITDMGCSLTLYGQTISLFSADSHTPENGRKKDELQ